MPAFAEAVARFSLESEAMRDGRGWPLGCDACVELQGDDRPCDAFYGPNSPPCPWKGAPRRVVASVQFYAAYGALAADYGGWEPIISRLVPDAEEQTRLLRLLAVIHRTVTQVRQEDRDADAAAREEVA